MKVMFLNAVPYGSTGKTMFAVADLLSKNGHQTLTVSGFSWHKVHRNNHAVIGNIISKAYHMYMSKIFGNHGYYSKIPTKLLIKKIQEFSPDIIHLHNIHGWYINIPMLFDYLKKCDIPIVWTLHDCWSFTGGCAHFTFCKCHKWLTGCGECNNLKEYPISSRVDRTKEMWHIKRECFCGLDNVTIVTPSQWLCKLVKQSFLGDYPVRVIHNGINLEVFRPIVSNFREKYGIAKEQHMVLGVSLGWNERKGLDVFVSLAKKLPDDYKIVLVGTASKVDKCLPSNVISIHRTQNQTELAEIYSAADVFVQTTREENYPTVNMEAIACGTPVLTFRTGGSPEMLDESCGAVVPCDDIDALEKEIIHICTDMPYLKEQCAVKSKEFDQNMRFKEYIELYETIISTRDQEN